MNVSIVVPDYSLSQGINAVVDQFLFNRLEFEKKGISISGVYDSNGYYPDPVKRKVTGDVSSLSGTSAGRLKKMAFFRSSLGQTLIILYRYMVPAFKVKRKLDQQISNENLLLFQSSICAWFYLKKKKRLPVVLMTHMYDDELQNLFMDYQAVRGTWFEKKLRRTCSEAFTKAEYIITISKHSEQSVRKTYPVHQIRTIYNSFKKTTEAMPKTEFCKGGIVRFVMASHLTQVKGMDLFIDAVSGLPREILEKCEFHLYGEGELRNEIEEKIHASGLKNITLYGRVERPYQYYTDKDVFLSTSRLETLPMGIIEAMSMGLAIMATKVGAIDELVSEENGILTEPDEKAIRDGVIYIIQNREQLAQMGMKSYQRYIDSFEISGWVDSFSSVFQSCAE